MSLQEQHRKLEDRELEASELESRAERERAASNEGAVYRRNAEIRSRFAHVQACPNTVYAKQRTDQLIAAAAQGKTVLDFGCGNGHLGRKLVTLGAARVHGIDISERFVDEARTLAHGDERLTYSVENAATFAGGRYDVIVGSAILHHLDWRPVLQHLYDNVLNPGGTMFFSEPLGESLALRAYWRFFPNAHTEDETPFLRSDIRWLRENFPGFEFHVMNYVSLVAGIVSSMTLKTPDNLLMRASDRIDRALERLDFMKPAFRYGLFVIRKEG